MPMSCDQDFHVAGGARIDGARVKACMLPGKHDLASVFLEDRLRQRDRRGGIGIGVSHKFAIGMNAVHDADDG